MSRHKDLNMIIENWYYILKFKKVYLYAYKSNKYSQDK